MAELKQVQSLRTSQTQTITLNQRIIQSLKILQATTMELQQQISVELVENPCLEEVDIREVAVSDADQKKDEQEGLRTQDDIRALDEATEDMRAARKEDELFSHMTDFARDEDAEKRDPFAMVASSITLADHLMEQVYQDKRFTPELVDIAELIVGNLDRRGFLTVPLDEIQHELLNGGAVGEQDLTLVEEALRLIQTLDPTGIGARDLRESLMIQMRERKMTETFAYMLVDKNFHDLGRLSVQQFAKKLDVPEAFVEKALKDIGSLNPDPGGPYSPREFVIAPDMVVEKIDEAWEIIYNDNRLPSLRISPHYQKLMEEHRKLDSESRSFLRAKIDHAKYFLQAIYRRRSTMVDVMRVIVEHQMPFFEKGIPFLRPLTMDQVAQEAGIHLSTVSRVANGKYVQCPHGIFEIRYFFTNALHTSEGGFAGPDISSRTAKAVLAEIVENEPKDKPYSDEALVKKMAERKIELARRTVAKYREEANIPPARLRKRG